MPHHADGGNPPGERTDAEAEDGRDLPPAARRALEEATARRAVAPQAADAPVEYHGRKGLEPVRYGDWEVKGIASDF